MAVVPAHTPAGLADDRGMCGSGSRYSHAGNGGLSGGCGEAENDGAADERQRNDSASLTVTPRIAAGLKVRRWELIERDIQNQRSGRSEDPPH